MNESSFWQLIESSRNEVMSTEKGPSLSISKFERLLVEFLERRLNTLPVTDVYAFAKELEEKKRELYRYDLWAIAYIIHRGCSDDHFDSFRNWVIFQGEDFYWKVVKDPKYVAEIAMPGQNLSYELVETLPIKIYEKKSGIDYEYSIKYTVDYNPAGEPWLDDDLPRLFPDACKKFSFGNKSISP